MNLLLPLFACLIQDPQPTPPVVQAPAAVVPLPTDPKNKLDVIKLKNGDELIGRITAELDGYVEVKIEDGATVGISRGQVLEIKKGAVAAPRKAAVVRASDAWFVLHDADGASVGWLHSSVTTAGNGTFTVNEEYEFQNGSRRYQITNQCTADQDGRGLRCYYRERVSQPQLRQQMPGVDASGTATRVDAERIVEAKAVDGQLVVNHLDNHGRHERQLPWSKEATFPLLARTLARQATSVIGPVSMFDPRSEELVIRRVDGRGARQILVDGVKQRVSEVAETDAAGTSPKNREWVDAQMRTVRRELAGPALVAVPSSAATARRAVGVSSIQSAVVAEADGRFGLWIPNPAWVAVEPLPPGHLTLNCATQDAEVRLSLLNHLPAGTVLDTAADAVGNWITLLYPQLQVDSRFYARIRGRKVIRMSATDSRNVQRATVDVIPYDDHYLVLICRGKVTSWNELTPDFAFVRRTLELSAQALTPKPQGPLSNNRGGRLRPPAGPIPAPTPAARVKANDNNVRIPK